MILAIFFRTEWVLGMPDVRRKMIKNPSER